MKFHILLLSFIVFPTIGNAQVYYVDIDAIGNNNGSSWEDAFTNLQDAIDTATLNQEIWVAEGVYFPTASPDGVSTNPRDKSFYLDEDIKMYGGFESGDTTLSQRDLTVNETILSGDFMSDDQVTGGGSSLIFSGNGENAYHVIISKNLTTSAVIDGFTVKGGNANGNGLINYESIGFNRGYGGGMYNSSSSSLIITNMTFIHNYAQTNGGGIYNTNYSSPIISNSITMNNKALLRGGGMANSYSSPEITNSCFTNNDAYSGGGIFNSHSSPIINSTIIKGNWGVSGGGMHNSRSLPIIKNSIFSSNQGSRGGAVYNFDSSIDITNSTIANNYAGVGSGMESQYSSPNITNCIFWNSGDIEIFNAFNSSPAFKNSIIRGSGGSFNWNNSYGNNNGVNLDTDPFFVDVANNDFSLLICSNAIDAGDNATWINTGDSTDIEGNIRPFDNGVVDIGAHEYQGLPSISISTPMVSQPNCAIPMGTIIVNATSTTGILEYSIDNGTTYQSSATFSSLSAGDYVIKVREQGTDCDRVYGGNPVVITPVLTVNTPTVTHVTCAVSTGTIVINATASTGTIEYSIDNGTTFQTSATFSGLSVGDYVIKVREQGTDCEEVYGSNPVTINPLPTLTISAPTVTQLCAVSTGTIVINATASTGTLVYSINNGATFQTSATFGDLPAGSYMIKIKELVSTCEEVYGSNPVVINPLPTLTVSAPVVMQQTCAVPSGTIVVDATTSIGTLEFSINNGMTFQASATFSGLPVGSYSIAVREQGSTCEEVYDSNPVVINPLPTLAILTPTIIQPTCIIPTGTIEVNATTSSGLLEYSIDGGMTYQSSATFSGIPIGSYTILIREQGTSCEETYSSNPVVINSLPTLSILTPTLTQPTCAVPSGTIVVNASTSTGAIEYSIDNGMTYQASAMFSGLSGGNYTIKIRELGSFCTDTFANNPVVINSPYANAIYVYVDAIGNNDGSSWTDAYTDLQDAIDNSCSGLDIWVAAGTYHPTKDHTGNPSPINNRDKNFHLTTDMKIYGGFTVTDSLLTQRNWATNVTTLSGDFNNNDTITGGGSSIIFSGNDENAYHVIISYGLSPEALIDGFVIKGGNADTIADINYQSQNFNRSNGGGIFNNSSSPTITNSKLINNSAYRGAGMYNNYSSPVISNLTITNNNSNVQGGGIFNRLSSPTITNLTFTNNNAVYDGGGIFNSFSSSPSITNTIIWENGINEIVSPPGNITTFKNSLIKGSGGSGNWNNSYGIDDGGNVDTDPLFVDVITKDYSLLGCSEAINAGDSLAWLNTGLSTDIVGSARPFNGTIVDIGAYEYQGALYDNAIYVNINAIGNNDGSSWTDAYTELQDAVDNQCGGLDVWVAEGIYFPTDSPDDISTDPRDKAFHLATDMKIYGGFEEGDSLLSQRNWIINETVLSGDFNNDDVVTGEGNTLSFSGNDENAYHVMITADLTSAALLDGFMIYGGNADSSGPINYQSKFFGRKKGGGIFNAYSSPTITNVSFSNNNSDDGGGMYNRSSSSIIMNTTFTNNKADNNGGGMHNTLSSSPTITNTTFENNKANDGGGIYNVSSSSSILNSIFSHNYSDVTGGAIYNESVALSITNSIITNNVTSDGGGGIYNYNTTTTITNSTFANNSAGFGGGIYNDDGTSTIINSIIWDNGISEVGNYGSIIYKNSLIKGSGGSTSWDNDYGYDYGGNLDIDPLFTDVTNGEFTLDSSSPAINTGDGIFGISENTGTIDLAGYPRFVDVIDMGAYENQCKEHLILSLGDSPLSGIYKASQTITIIGAVEVMAGVSLELRAPLVTINESMFAQPGAIVKVKADGCN